MVDEKSFWDKVNEQNEGFQGGLLVGGVIGLLFGLYLLLAAGAMFWAQSFLTGLPKEFQGGVFVLGALLVLKVLFGRRGVFGGW